jgi:hypothetical protein
MKCIASLLFIFVLLSSPSFARNKDSATVRFSTSVRVDSKNLPEGIYKMTWTGSGAEADVSFVQDKTVIVTVPAKVVQAQNDWVASAEIQSSVVTKQEDGATVVQEIQLPHLNFSLGRDAITQQGSVR